MICLYFVDFLKRKRSAQPVKVVEKLRNILTVNLCSDFNPLKTSQILCKLSAGVRFTYTFIFHVLRALLFISLSSFAD